MPRVLRFCMPLSIAIILVAFALWQGDTAWGQNGKPREVQIVVDPYTPENGIDPMANLLKALDDYPDENLFRVTWKFSGFLQGIGSAVYNREEQTVKYWYHTHTPEYADTEFSLVLQVNPELMKQVLQTKKNQGATDGAFFDRLHEYGGTRKDLQHRHRSF
ncbi:MAG: hypothetical protein ACYC6A_12190 [Armatimonadota bacterium]